jgi:preprotein translocase subunit SecA
VEYKNEAFQSFEQLKHDIQFEIATNIFRVEFVKEQRPGTPPRSAAPAMVTSGPVPPEERQGLGVEGGPAVAAPARAGAAQATAARPSGSATAAPQAGNAAAALAMGGKVGRNDPCPCGSGRKYKRCHGR